MVPTSPHRDQIPPGSVDYVMAILRRAPGFIKRRKLLEELERGGHRISLAGLNRILQVCTEENLISDGPDGPKALVS